eukprot:Skav218923  [mRNA]  locus=scaffold2031:18320:23007:+ [translate_table: standard]
MGDYSLDIPDPQVLVHFPHDHNGITEHHRILLVKLSPGRWVASSPDFELEVLDLNLRRHTVIGRRTRYPDDLNDVSYVFDPISRNELEDLRRKAKTMAVILGDGAQEAIQAMVWVYADPSSSRLGKEVPREIADNAVLLGQKGIVEVEGEAEWIQEIAMSDLPQFSEQRKGALGDIRTIGQHTDSQNKRFTSFPDAMSIMKQADVADWGFKGPRATREFLTSILEGGTDLAAYHLQWVKHSGVNPKTSLVYEHKTLMESLRLAICRDQLNPLNCMAFEILVRRLIQLEVAVGRSNHSPEFSGLEVLMESPLQESGAATTKALDTWLTEQLKSKSQIQKQARLYREEFGHRAPGASTADGGFVFAAMRGAHCSPGTNIHSERHWEKLRSHGDPFPLDPCWVESSALKKGVSFPQRGNWSASSLNSLALQDSNSNIQQFLRDRPPTHVQTQVIDRIVECLQDAEEPPEGFDGPTCLQSMTDGKCLYNEEPKNLASYEFEKVKVLKAQLKPRRLEEVLPSHARSILQRYQSLIEKSSSEVAAEEPCDITPYWDPKLQHSDKEKVRLIVALANQGLVTFRRSIKERIGLFFVKKKTPEYIRLVLDSRRVNAHHKTPPTTRLATPRSYLDIQFGCDGDKPLAYGIEADVADCFYNYYSEELASWFGLDRPGTIGFWKSSGWNGSPLYDDSTGTFYEPLDSDVVFPVFRGLSMGWAWSLYFANESVNYITAGMVERPLHEIRDKAPPPSLDDGPVTGVYVDNISIIARSKAEATEAARRVAEHFQKANIPLTWSTPEPVTCFETVGIILDFNHGTIRNKPKRLWKAFFAGRELLRRKRVPVKLVEIWLGHMTSLFMLTPAALSSFFHIYRFVQQHRHHRAVIWSSVRREIKHSLGLLWLTTSHLSFDPVLQVDCGDSSSGAFALLTTWAKKGEVAEICKFREAWRFQPLPIEVQQAAATGSRAELIKALDELGNDWTGGILHSEELQCGSKFGAGFSTEYADWLIAAMEDNNSWIRTSAVRSQLKAKPRRKLEYEAPTMVPPLPEPLCNKNRYSLLWRKRWRKTDMHINAKEAMVCVSSLRRTARVASLHRKLKVTLTDNITALTVFERGRSSSFALNRLCRNACAYQLACGLRWRLRHIETLRNPADEDSRFHQHRTNTSSQPQRKLLPVEVGRNMGKINRVRPRTEDVETGLVSQAAQICEHPSSSSSSTAEPSRGAGLFLEIFAGTGRLTAAIKNAGMATLAPIDFLNGSHHDMRRRASQLAVLAFLKAGWVRFVHLGTPCTVFSRARHFIKNHERARERERVGVELGLFSAEVIEVCNRYNIHWSLENPRSSRLFELPFLSGLLHRKGVVRVDVDFCQYGEPYKKPTSIFSTFAALQQLEARCNHVKHSTLLRGSERVLIDGKWVTQPKTKAAGAYPYKLVERWATILLPEVQRDSQYTAALAEKAEHELQCSCQKTKVGSRPILARTGTDSLLIKYERIQPGGIEAVVFGQHSNEEARTRREQQVKVSSIHTDLGGRHSQTVATAPGFEDLKG